MKEKHSETETFVAFDTGKITRYSVCCPYPEYEIGLNLANFPYPYFHTHDFWEMTIVTSGKLYNYINGQSLTMNIGDCNIIRPEDNHKIDFSEGKNCQYITIFVTVPYIKKVLDIYSDDLYETFSEEKDLRSLFCTLKQEDLAQIENLVVGFKSFKISKDRKVQTTKIIFNKVLNEIINKKSERGTNAPNWLSDFLATLSNPYFDVSDSERVARLTPYGYSRLAHIFKNYTGRSIVDFCMHIKIEHAKGLLRNSDKTVTEIAMELRFADASYFTRVFRKRVGMSPLKYRKYANS